MSITKAQLHEIAPTLRDPKLSLFLDPINETMIAYNISTLSEQAMFLAQIMHESMACFYTKELASGTAYEGRKDLGNTQPGDGIKYKGRGLIQITGRFNYTNMMMDLGIDCVEHPEILETPEWATKSAGWFWNKHNLNLIADINDETHFELDTRRINGGLNGLLDRQQYWTRAKKVLGL